MLELVRMQKIKRKRQFLCLRHFAEFLFSLFHLFSGGIPSSCPGGTVLTAEQGPHLQLHPPLLGLQTPAFLLLLCLPFFIFFLNSDVAVYATLPAFINHCQYPDLSKQAQQTNPESRFSTVYICIPSHLMPSTQSLFQTLLIRTNPCFIAGHFFPFHVGGWHLIEGM